MLTISKSGGKVVKSDMTITKNFMINVRFVFFSFLFLDPLAHFLLQTFEIDGLSNSKATVIFTRA